MTGWWLTTLGTVMLCCSLGAKIIGLPRQITFSYRTKTAPPGTLSWFMWLGFASYVTQCLYNAMEGVWFTALAAAPGAVLTGIIIYQMQIYKVISKPDDYTEIDGWVWRVASMTDGSTVLIRMYEGQVRDGNPVPAWTSVQIDV